MTLDYKEIGRRIAYRRKALGLKQAQVSERAEISEQYLSNIERSVSIPSIEVVMRIAEALETTPDEFLVGTGRHEGEEWRSVAEGLRTLTPGQLSLVEQFIRWVSNQTL